MTGVATAMVLLALAMLVTGGTGGRSRLRGLTATPDAATAPAPPLRPAWVLVGAVALGSLACAAGGVVAGVLVGAGTGVTGMIAARRSGRLGSTGPHQVRRSFREGRFW